MIKTVKRKILFVFFIANAMCIGEAFADPTNPPPPDTPPPPPGLPIDEHIGILLVAGSIVGFLFLKFKKSLIKP